MNATGRGRRRLRGKMILPAIVLLVGFATAAVIGYTTESRHNMEARVEAELGHDRALFERIVAEQHERLALHSRFLADMVDLSNTFPEPRQSQSILIYLLDYLGQQRIATHLHAATEGPAGRHAKMVRQAGLGIRATGVLVDRDAGAPRVVVAGVAPVERVDGIEEVIVTEAPLDARFLRSLRPKMSSDVTLLVDDVAVATSHEDRTCAQVIASAAASAALDAGATIDCGGSPYRIVAGRLEAGGEDGPMYALSVSMAPLFAARATIVRNTLLGAAAALLLAVLVYSRVVRRVTGPIETLSSATRRVAGGELDVELKPTSTDEVGELSENFNLMVGHLRRSRERLEAYHARELEHSDRLATVGELAAGVAHEIRNPLAGIGGAIEMLRRDLEDLDGKGEILDEVQVQIERMNRLTTDLLAYSRPGEPTPQPYCIHRAIDEALFLLESGRRESHVTVRKDYGDGVPSVRVDPQQIHQVLLNVLLNASQAMPDGGAIEVRTRAGADGGGGTVVVEIRDHGEGVPEDVLHEAMRPFVTTKMRGTGLGLAIAKRILDGHGGTLAIENVPEGGARVLIGLPVCVSPSLEASAS